MSNYTIEVTENVVNLDVLKDHDVVIEIKSSDNFITFDTPSGYPISFTSGILPVSRVGSGYLIENLTSGNTIARTFGDQTIGGNKTFSNDIVSSGNLAIKSQATSITPSYFPVFISDPSTFSRNIYTRTSSQVKSDLALNNVQNIALSGVNFVAGSGLVGGGSLSSSKSFDIGQGDGLIVGADNISVDSTVVRTSGGQTINGGTTFSGTGVKITTGAIGVYRKDIVLKGNAGTLFNNTVTIIPTNNLYTDRTYYLPEAGFDADFVMTAGSQIIVGQKTFTSTVIFNSGTFQSLKLGGIDVSVSGHTHTSSNITDFNTSVDSRITNANLQPSGNYSLVGHTHNISDITSLQTTLDNKQPSGNYALSSHTHTSSNITDFNSSVSGLLPVKNVTGTGYVNISSTTGNYTVSVTGLQPSGSYASSSHNHSSSDITNFNTSVSGLVNGIYAPLSSPTFTGTPLTPTASAGTNNTQIASTAFVRTEISNLVASAPTALDTLNELAAALGNDANFATTVNTNIGTKASLSGAIFTGSISSPSGNFTSLKVSGIPLINGGYNYEIHVSQIDGNDTTGNGDLLNPVASITKALTLVGSQRKTIIVHPGGYNENPSITVPYTTITGPGLIGGNIVLYGTLSTNTGCTIAGIKMTNLTIATPTGAGNVNILNCEISGTFTKSSNADYTVLRLCDYGSASITGAGLVAIFGGNPNFTIVNNASANVIIKSAVTVAPVLTSGTLSLVDSIVVAAATNAITSASSSIITLANCQMLTLGLSNVAPVVLNGFYSILNCVYDKTTSTLVALSATGGSTNSIDYFQYINADKFITQGGTSSQYVKGDGSLALFPDNIVYTSGNQTISGVKTFSDLPFVNGTGVSISGHTHTASNITNFNSSVSGLLTPYQLALTNPVTGVGTSGYLTRWSGSNSISSGIIFDNGTNIGINTINPSGKFHIENAVANNSYILLSNPGSVIKTHIGVGNSDTIPFLASINNIQSASGTYGWGLFDRGTDGALQIQRRNGTTSWVGAILFDRNNGNVGIGTGVSLDSRDKLTVDGNIKLGDTAGTKVQFYRGGGTAYDYTIGKEGNHLAISTASDDTTFRYTQFGYHASNGTWNPKTVINGFNGSVGINTLTPSGFFDIKGDMYVRSSGVNGGFGKIYFPATNYGTDNSLWIGLDSSQNFLISMGSQLYLSPNGGSAFLRSSSTSLELGQGYNAGTDAQHVKFTPGGTELMRMTCSGTIGIGTTTPLGTCRLTIAGSGSTSASSALNIVNSGNSPLLFVRNDGNVGIGTTTPSTQLHVIGSGIFTSGITVGDSSSNSYIYGAINPATNNIRFNNGGADRIDFNSSQLFYVGTSFFQGNNYVTRAGETTSTATQKDSYQLIFQNALWDGAASQYWVNTIVSTASTAQNLTSRLAFRTHNGINNTQVERMCITSSGGYVGIGTTTPTAQLQVVGTGLFTNIDINNSAIAGSAALTVNGNIITQNNIIRGGTFSIYGDNNTRIYKVDASTLGYVVSSSGYKHSFGYENLGTHMPWMVIGSGGVGIGTTTPSGALHIVGDTYIDDGARLYIVGSGTSKTRNFIRSVTNGNLEINAGGPSVLFSPDGGYVELGRTVSQYINIGHGYLNTGANNQHVRFTPGGSELMRMTNSGTMGIGLPLTSLLFNQQPYANTRVHIAGSGADSGSAALIVTNSGISPLLYVRNDGNIGVGTTTPSGQLHVVGTGIFSSNLSVGSTSTPRTVYISGAIPTQGELLRIQNGSSSTNTYLDIGVGTLGSYDDHVIFYRGTGTGSNTRIFGIDNSNRLLGFVNWAMFGNTTITSYNNGNSLIKMQNLTTNDMEISAVSGIIFQSSQSTKMRMDQNGRLGIGTTTPSSQLHVIGSGVISSGLIVNGNLTFDSFTESVVAIGNSSTSQTISLTSGTVQTCTLTGNCTFTMPTATAGKSFSLFLNTGGGSFTATFTSVKWAGGSTPTITTTASKTDILSFISDGTYWYGSYSQNY